MIARQIVARFRPWGRDPAMGLDCVGLAALAFGVRAPRDYALRGGGEAWACAAIVSAGLRPIESEGAEAGDLVLLDEGVGQLHLAVLTEAGFVHADARLRRIVETPGRPASPTIGAWRKED